MKKVLFTVLIIFSFIGVINASDYSCEIIGDDIIYSNSEKTSYINVNITNIDEIKSFRMYIKYENKKYKVDTCQFLNYNTTSCFLRVNDKSLIYYDYNYNKDYKLHDYPFFYASFKSIDKTPSEGESTITVYFEDVKTNENKNVTITDCNKTFTFVKESDEKLVKVDKFNIEIEGYSFEFDPDTLDYYLYVEDIINNLDIKVSAPDNYKYTINGATDLNTFGNKVTINVTDNKGKEKVYTINVMRDKESLERTDIKKDVKNTLKDIKKYLPYILIVLVIIIIIMLIVHKKDNKKMDKYLDNL